jgi:Na+/H+ antiporter NhaD/arsenite permease-like protein
MNASLIVIFLLGYLAIIFEEKIGVNKTASALITGILCWVFYAINASVSPEIINHQLNEHLAEISQILFFLMGAMTVVEVIDANQGFAIVTDLIRTKSLKNLLFITTIITFFLSAALDNLTTAIVITSLLRKLITNGTQRKLFTGMVIIAANSGGAWSPIGDVTTTMLWIGGQVSPKGIGAPVLDGYQG